MFADGGYSLCSRSPVGWAFPAFPGSAEICGCQTLLWSMLRAELSVFKSQFCAFLCNPKPFSRNECELTVVPCPGFFSSSC